LGGTWGILIAALFYVAVIIPTWVAHVHGAPLGQQVSDAGPDLARRLGCFACHRKAPGHLASSLDGSGARLTREHLQVVLLQPRQLYPGAKMPSYAYLPEGERRALLDFLERSQQFTWSNSAVRLTALFKSMIQAE
jgi:cbb3-type cytochrome oxidase cytochrome c subunit